jgi:hypothetical protein
MRKSKFSEAQIIGFLERASAGLLVKDLCRQEEPVNFFVCEA